MAPSKPSSGKKSQPYTASKIEAEVELEPDAWPKFEKLIRDASKTGTQLRKKPPASQKS